MAMGCRGSTQSSSSAAQNNRAGRLVFFALGDAGFPNDDLHMVSTAMSQWAKHKSAPSF
eukprot:gene22164-1299_t